MQSTEKATCDTRVRSRDYIFTSTPLLLYPMLCQFHKELGVKVLIHWHALHCGHWLRFGLVICINLSGGM